LIDTGPRRINHPLGANRPRRYEEVAEVAPPTLQIRPWKATYRHEDGDLIGLFYVPALECAASYDRMTGYFTADALALAGRGIEHLIANNGKMRLIVGCTLDEDEARAIEQGYEFREIVEASLLKVTLTPPNLQAEGGLAALAWLVAQGRLDVKIAVPVDSKGLPFQSFGLYHEKVGIITDRENNRLSFSGSINETRGGWLNNRESFHVHCSWEGGREAEHVAQDVEAFDRLWNKEFKTVRVYDFSDALREKILAFLPKDNRFTFPNPQKIDPPSIQEPKPFALKVEPSNPNPQLNFDDPPRVGADKDSATPGSEVESDPTVEPILPYRLMPNEVRQVVWGYVANAARLENGARVGEATSAVKPWPHQLRTFARLYEKWPCRLLIADEVGLGKTISAGLLMRQAWLSGRARRILLMVPASVMVQWQNELYEKFNLNVPIYDGQSLHWRKTHGQAEPVEAKVGRDDWHKEPFVLCSSHLMRRKERAAEIVRAEDWDLVILDEAHHARRKSPGSPQEGGPNRLLSLMQQLKDKTKSLVLLSATPMQVHPVEVWDLLRLLGLPPRWEANKDDFARYFRVASGNPGQADFEFLAEMFQSAEATFGPVDEQQLGRVLPTTTSLIRQKVLKALRDRSAIRLKRLDTAARNVALETLRRYSPIRHLMSRHTRSLLRQYHKAGLIDAPIATRDVRDVPVRMNDAEGELYRAVEDYISTTYNNAAQGEKSAVGFVMTIYRRRLASTFHALYRTLVKRLSNEGLSIDEEDVSQDELRDEVMDHEDGSEIARRGLIAEERESINSLLKRIAKLGSDTKLTQLKTEIQDAFQSGYSSAIVFTQYTDSMDRVKEFLSNELVGISIATYSGSGGTICDAGGFWNSCTKERIKQKLKDGSIRLLICTDAAAEGLNFQTCGVLINLDLPWNPMKVEQRIGRIDRIGQRHETIRVVNLAYEDTVESDVYFALGRRINLFQGIVGRLQPILSRLPYEFERVALESVEHREAARERLLSDVDQMIDAAEEADFDMDEVGGDALELPDLPAPALTLGDLDDILNRSDLRPADVEWAQLDRGSYSIRLPGMTQSVRGTTRAEVFDVHYESHEFMSPGGEFFQQIVARSNVSAQADRIKGNFWFISSDKSDDGFQAVVLTLNGVKVISSVDDLVNALNDLAMPGELGLSLTSKSTASCFG